ncbi:hypothetical protein ABK040_016163 [Willaertia magna]
MAGEELYNLPFVVEKRESVKNAELDENGYVKPETIRDATLLPELDVQRGKNYKILEPTFYRPLTRVKDAGLPSDRINVPNADYLSRNREGYLSNEQILDIFGKPLDSKDYEVKSFEVDELKKDPKLFKSMLHLTPAAPCRAHLLNMFTEECYNPDLGKSNETMLQWSGCNRHFYKWTTCLAKHRKWYEARYEALAKVQAPVTDRAIQDTDLRKDPSTYRQPRFD